MLTVVSCLWLPLFQAIWWFSMPAIAAAWAWAVLWSFAAVMTYLSLKRYVRSFVTLTIAVLLGVVIFRIDWQTSTSTASSGCTGTSSPLLSRSTRAAGHSRCRGG
ncbi:hypothetical protein DMB42_37965 [Nonomuraea sp. WAC 01424]|nr:hypothetical protein DMB42_37965 [Nonomuraea sp. WAC 01424]